VSLQVHCCRSDTSPSATVVNFISPINGQIFTSTEHRGTVICATAGVFSNWNIALPSAPGGGKSFTFTLRKNQVDTAAVIVISGTNTSGSYIPAISLAEGDEITIRCTPASTPTVSEPSICWDFSSSNISESIYGMANTAGPIAVSRENRFFFAIDASNWTTPNAREIVTTAGVVSKYIVKLDATPAGGTTLTFLVTKNGTDQDGSGGTSDTRLVFNNGDLKKTATFSLSLAEGDLTTFKCNVTGSPGTPRPIFGLVYTSTTEGESIFGSNFLAALDTTLTEYGRVGSSIPNSIDDLSVTEANEEVVVGITGFNLRRMRVALNSSPGAGTSYQFTTRRRRRNTALKVTISDLNTSGSKLTGAVALNSGDTFDVQVLPTGTPSTRNGGWFFVQTQTGDPTSPPVIPSLGVPVSLFLVSSADFPFDGTAFALPVKSTRITWKTQFAVAPASIQIDLEISLDGINWATLDSTTSTSGEIRSKRVNAPFIRAVGVSASGGSGITAFLTAYKEKN